MKINKPRYEVVRDDETHIYTIRYMVPMAVNPIELVVPGTTGILDSVGSKEKTNMLMGWAKKMALEKVQEHLRPLVGKAVTIDDAWIDAVRKSAWKRDKDKLKEAGDIGTRIHSAIDAHILGKAPILDEQTEPAFNNFLHWVKDCGIKLIQGDTFVGSVEYKYGGALDALGERDGKLVLLDWKTSNSMRDTYPLQVAAYANAFQECYNQDISEAWVIRFGKEIKGDIEPKQVNLAKSWDSFKAALELTNRMKEAMWI